MDISRQIKQGISTGELVFGQRGNHPAHARWRRQTNTVAANCPQEHVDVLASNHPNIPVHRLQMVNRGSARMRQAIRSQLDLHNRCRPVGAHVPRSQPLKRLVDGLHAWERMGDAVLRALESEGIVLDTSVDAVAPVGFSFLGECKSTPASLGNLSVWHAPYTHLHSHHTGRRTTRNTLFKPLHVAAGK